MKCLCGYEFKEAIITMNSLGQKEVTEEQIGHTPFLELQIMTSGTFEFIRIVKGKDVTLYACPECKTVRIED